MSTALRDLYQEIILEHSRNPKNSGIMANADAKAMGNNPLCGDRIVVYLKLDGDRIQDARFDARGCAISVASASMMMGMLIGKTIAEVKKEHNRFTDLLISEDDPCLADDDELSALMGVREFPARLKCATLPWEALVAAVDGNETDVTTE